MSVTGTRVFGHPQVVEYQAYVTRESSHFLRHAPSAFRLEHADGETAKPSNVFRTIAGPDATAVKRRTAIGWYLQGSRDDKHFQQARLQGPKVAMGIRSDSLTQVDSRPVEFFRVTSPGYL